ncbi:MAG: type II secretion system protein GspC [Desulfobacteraceae bacterium]
MKIQRAITLVNLAFIALGTYFAAGLFYQIWGLTLKSSEPPPKVLASRTAGAVVAQKPYSSYRVIDRRDLFKTRKTAATPATNPRVILEELGETSLNLKLWGTVTGDPEKSYAVIENTQNRQQNLYRVGDSVQNATLKMILRSQVVLTHNGRDEMLAMEKIQQGSSTAARRPIGRPTIPLPAGIRTQRVSLRRSMINDAMQDVSKLMTEIKISPHIGEDGQPSGLAVSNIKPNSIFRRMGLRNGDVLRSVDGQDIRSVDDALKLYESMKSANRISVQIQRRGRDRNIEYNIRQ